MPRPSPSWPCRDGRRADARAAGRGPAAAPPTGDDLARRFAARSRPCPCAGERYDVVMLTAVWMHLDQAQRERAMARVAPLVRPGGLMALSLRHGPVPAGRRMFDVTALETRALAQRHGLETILRKPGCLPAGRPAVWWDRLAFRAQRWLVTLGGSNQLSWRPSTYWIGSLASSSGETPSRQATLIDTNAPPISSTSPSPNGRGRRSCRSGGDPACWRTGSRQDRPCPTAAGSPAA